MRSFKLLLLLFLAICAEAAVFTSPIQHDATPILKLLKRHGATQSRPFHEALKHRLRRDQAQSSLRFGNDASASVDHRVEIWDGDIFKPYIVPAALGTPPQPFRLLIDLAWDTLFVPSADCSGDCEKPEKNLHFYANESSTYEGVFPDAWTVYGTDRFIGDMATDTFRIAGLELEHQYFINVLQANPLGFLSFYFGYDGALGLAPRFDSPLPSTSTTMAPSPWTMMVAAEVLDHNLFALELPIGVMDMRKPDDRHGEISFGGISEKYVSSDFLSLPLSNYSDQVWAAEAQYLTWQNETHWTSESFVNLTLAGLDTSSWFIGLPGNWPEKIYASVEHECRGPFCTVHCDKIGGMPNMTFGIGGREITLTSFDYVDQVIGPNDQKVCLFNVYPTRDQFPVDAIVLGKPFLEAFYR